MNHSFQLGTVNKSQCNKCGRAFIDHTTQATCEACGKKANCNVIGSLREYDFSLPDGTIEHRTTGVMLLCADCESKEKEIEIVSETDISIPEDKHREQVVNLLNALDKEIPLDSRHYFNAEITSIVDIEAKLAEELGTDTNATKFKLAEVVENRLRGFKTNLFEIKQLELNLKVNMVADQRYLNKLVPQLREEERAKFKDYDITYTPPKTSPTSKPSGPRTSAKDKAVESFAAMMKISVEQAKIVLSKAVASTIKCTCAETPGLCRVHPTNS